MTPVAIARDAEALKAADFSSPEVIRRPATINDTASLDISLKGAHAVINCAGPFIDTADAVAGAALRAGIHYVDVCAEQASAKKTLESFDAGARQASVAVVPSMAFYGGLPDLMVTAALKDWNSADSVEIMMGLDSWHPTRGTRNTIDRIGQNPAPRMIITGGKFTPLPATPAQKDWRFPAPIGEQTMIEVPFSEIILISRHVKTGELHNYLSTFAVKDVLNPSTPAPKAADEHGRSPQRFIVEVVVTRGKESRRATVQGRDIYAISAPLICEATERLLAGRFSSPGAHAPGEIFNAGEVLTTLRNDSTFELAEN
jgi:short subunit dehydrogenase-like uncharacterized protein